MNGKPNILFLLTDDQRFDTIHALGNEQIITPNLDFLVKTGVYFNNAYIMGGSCGAVCMPSRAMMLTGRGLYQIEREGQSIPKDHKILPEYFKELGYRAFGTGKWHNGVPSYGRSFSDGAEIFFGGMDDHWNVPACDFNPTGNYPAPQERPVPWIPGKTTIDQRRFDHIQVGVHSTDIFADAAIDFLHSLDGEQTFFAYVSFMAPHDPRTMPQEYREMYDPDDISLPPNFHPRHPFDNGALETRDEQLEAWPRAEAKIREHIADYYAMITHLDAAIGRILQALDDTGKRENTIIVLTGDNGLALGQHGLMGKQNNYEHSLHVPLILNGPGVPPGVRNEALCYLIDIFPTLCELSQVEVPPSVLGQSLLPAFEPGTAPQHRAVLHFAYLDKMRSVRDQRYKLIEYSVNGERTTQLFDLSIDPYETTNLITLPAYRGDYERLKIELRKWRTELNDNFEQGNNFWTGLSASD